jgi:pimeloyl-ACP methyl ester carboxylesterase
MSTRKSLLKCTLLAIPALLLTGCSISLKSPPPTPTPMPSGMVDVGGYSLYYECSGQGSPTVIMENGGGGAMSDWADVFDGIKNTTKVCMYDRANLGRSDSVSGTRTLYDMTRDLQALLKNGHIGGPYILVGWSFGGMLVRIYADQHPNDVVGVVLLDSAHPDMGDRLLACLPPESEGEAENVQFARQYTTWISDSSKGSPFTSGEGMGWDTRTNNQQARDVETLGDVPLVVISQAPNIPGLGLPLFTSRGLLPAEIDACMQQTWQDMQDELAGLSSNTTRLTARGGHMIPIEQPELVVDAIKDLVEQLR